MTSSHSFKSILVATVGIATYLQVVGIDHARAERRTNDLAKQDAVRHRRLMVKNRLEVAPLFESSIAADFRHIVGGGLKLEYHISDMFSIGALGVGSIAINTKLVDQILPTLAPNSQKLAAQAGDDGMAGTGDDIFIREPSREEFQHRLNEMPLHGAAYIGLTPWYGKLAAFGTAFVAFDFYFQAGVSYAQLKSSCPTNICTDNPSERDPDSGIPPDLDPNNDVPLNDGTRIGLYLGGGIHVFLNDYLALDLTVRDYAFRDNPSGADVSGPRNGPDGGVTDDDNKFVHHLFFGAGISVMFPFTVKRTR